MAVPILMISNDLRDFLSQNLRINKVSLHLHHKVFDSHTTVD